MSFELSVLLTDEEMDALADLVSAGAYRTMGDLVRTALYQHAQQLGLDLPARLFQVGGQHDTIRSTRRRVAARRDRTGGDHQPTAAARRSPGAGGSTTDRRDADSTADR